MNVLCSLNTIPQTCNWMAFISVLINFEFIGTWFELNFGEEMLMKTLRGLFGPKLKTLTLTDIN